MVLLSTDTLLFSCHDTNLMWKFLQLILKFVAADYEAQRSHILTLVAVDGGNRSTAVSVHIDVEDVNDNAPKFELQEFSRTIRAKSSSFQPEFFIKAVDADGPQQGGGRMRYEVSKYL